MIIGLVWILCACLANTLLDQSIWYESVIAGFFLGSTSVLFWASGYVSRAGYEKRALPRLVSIPFWPLGQCWWVSSRYDPVLSMALSTILTIGMIVVVTLHGSSSMYPVSIVVVWLVGILATERCFRNVLD